MSDRYFKRRPRSTSSGFEEDYWGKVVDPDGKTRDRRKERQQFLENAENEKESALVIIDALARGIAATHGIRGGNDAMEERSNP